MHWNNKSSEDNSNEIMTTNCDTSRAVVGYCTRTKPYGHSFCFTSDLYLISGTCTGFQWYLYLYLYYCSSKFQIPATTLLRGHPGRHGYYRSTYCLLDASTPDTYEYYLYRLYWYLWRCTLLLVSRFILPGGRQQQK